MEITIAIFNVTEIVGTIAFAVSGALIAIERRLDLFGVLFLGIVTALGGGTMRDILLGVFPPRAFYNYEYLAIAFFSALAVFIVVWSYRARTIHALKRRWKASIMCLMPSDLPHFPLPARRSPLRRAMAGTRSCASSLA